MPGVFAVDGHVYYRAHAVAFDVVDIQAVHELVVAGCDCVSIYRCNYALAAEFLDVGNAASVYLPAVGRLKALAYGMRARALGERSVFYKRCVVVRAVVYTVDLEHSLGQRSGLVKYHYARLAECFQVVGTLDEHALFAGPADTGEEAQRDAYDQCAGAARHEEGQRAVNPGPPVAGHIHPEYPHQRRNDGQQQRAAADSRCVNAGKAADKGLAAALAAGGILNEVQYLAYRALAKLLSSANLQKAGHVDAS